MESLGGKGGESFPNKGVISLYPELLYLLRLSDKSVTY